MSGARLAFAGLGWIGLQRMEALLRDGNVAVALADPSPEALARARAAAPDAAIAEGFDALLAHDVDGVVVATPSALHAAQSIAALRRGLAVFCQKPLGRDAVETAAIVDAARRAGRCLHVDLSYRHTAAFRAVHDLVRGGEIGDVYAADLVFHNAYGPDKAWFRDRVLSGGGCLLDLGIHLVDAARWVLGFPEVHRVSGALFAGGRRLPAGTRQIEDFVTAEMDLAGGARVRLACSWNLPAGRDAVIEAAFFGTDGGVAVRNVDGSFYDFVAERYRGTSTERLTVPPDAWGGRAACAWAAGLRDHGGYDAAVEEVVRTAAILDAIHAGA